MFHIWRKKYKNIKMKVVTGVVLLVCATFGLASVLTAVFPADTCPWDPSKPVEKVDSYIGVLMAVGASLLNAVGLLIIKLVLNDTDDYFSSPKWWGGFACITLAEVTNSIAYGYASAPVISCIGSVTIVGSFILAVVFLKERFALLSGLGTLVIFGGILMLIVATPRTSNMYTPQMLESRYTSVPTIVYASINLVSIGILARLNVYNLYRLATYAALVSSWTIVSVRGVVTLSFDIIHDCSECQCAYTFRNWVFWLLLVIVILSAWWGGGVVEQEGLRRFPQTKWVPVHFCTCFFFFSFSGIVVYDEFDIFTPTSVPLIVVGIVLCTWGIALINATSRVEVIV
jgi:drug/metabolite transporter (DMT)-like permease